MRKTEPKVSWSYTTLTLGLRVKPLPRASRPGGPSTRSLTTQHAALPHPPFLSTQIFTVSGLRPPSLGPRIPLPANPALPTRPRWLLQVSAPCSQQAAHNPTSRPCRPHSPNRIPSVEPPFHTKHRGTVLALRPTNSPGPWQKKKKKKNQHELRTEFIASRQLQREHAARAVAPAQSARRALRPLCWPCCLDCSPAGARVRLSQSACP